MNKYFYCFLSVVLLTAGKISAQLSAVVTPTNPTCAGNNGSALVTPSGGSGYAYKWSTGATTQTASGLGAGTYTVTVYSSGGGVNWDTIYKQTFDSTVQTWSTNISTGTNDPQNNFWDISDSCIGNGAIGTCVNNTYAPPPGSNKSLYVTAQYVGLSFPPGARYNNGGLCTSFSICVTTDLAAQSPNINTPGVHNLILGFQYTGSGDGFNDNASLYYSISGQAGPFIQLADSLKSVNSPSCVVSGDQEGTWAYKTYNLPITCNNINNLVIRFRWVNNDDAVGSDPSFAVDNISIRDSFSTAGTDSIVKTVMLTLPAGPQVNTTSLTITNSACGQTNGSITGLTGAGGALPYTYSWKNSSNTVIANTANLNNVGAGTYTFEVTDANGCKKDSAFIVSSGTSTPVASNTGPFCLGGTLQLSATTIAGATYSWTGPNNFNTQNPSKANITFADTGTYTVVATVGGCNSAGATTHVSIVAPPPTPVASNTGPICVGSPLQLNASGSALATYSWTGPNSFSTQNPSIASAALSDAGTYSVVASFGSCTSAPGNTTVVINPAPAAPTTGNSSPVCVGDTLNLTASTINGATYAWTGPNNFSQQNPSIHPVSLADSGTYSVVATIGNCHSAAATTRVVVNPSPAAPVITETDSLICGSDSSQICAPGTYAHYAWSNGRTTPCFYAKSAGNYYVTVSDNNGCKAISNHVSLSVLAQPSISISQNGDTLSINNVGTYQWYFGNSLIPGATSHIYVAHQAGQYFVVLTDTNGCSIRSSAVTVAVGISEVGAELGFEIYPNPVSAGSLQIVTEKQMAGMDLQVFDAVGRLVYSARIKSQKTEIMVDKFANGGYIVKVGSAVRRFIKE